LYHNIRDFKCNILLSHGNLDKVVANEVAVSLSQTCSDYCQFIETFKETISDFNHHLPKMLSDVDRDYLHRCAIKVKLTGTGYGQYVVRWILNLREFRAQLLEDIIKEIVRDLCRQFKETFKSRMKYTMKSIFADVEIDGLLGTRFKAIFITWFEFIIKVLTDIFEALRIFFVSEDVNSISWRYKVADELHEELQKKMYHVSCKANETLMGWHDTFKHELTYVEENLLKLNDFKIYSQDQKTCKYNTTIYFKLGVTSNTEK